MKTILLSLFAGSLFVSSLFANNATSNPEATQPTTTQDTNQANQNITPIDPDVKLKEDIVRFEREKYFQNAANKVDDPFIYVYPQTEDMVARKAELEQIVLTLKSIIVSPDSSKDGVKRYKAHINDKWVEECRLEDKKEKCDVVDGWKVVGIDEHSVKLKVDAFNLKKDLKLSSKKVTINKKEVNYK